jgi:hypothetical protein
VLVYRFVFETGGEGLCVACRGVGIYRGTFVALYCLCRQARSNVEMDTPSVISEVLALFDRLGDVEAQNILHRWQRDAEFLRAIWQVDSIPRNGKHS